MEDGKERVVFSMTDLPMGRTGARRLLIPLEAQFMRIQRS
jgi:hypothetical protein